MLRGLGVTMALPMLDAMLPRAFSSALAAGVPAKAPIRTAYLFLPNGMWDVMCKNGQNLLAGSITPDQYSANMKQEFQRLKTTA